MAAQETYYWQQMGTIPSQAGIYAWYFSPHLADSDIATLRDEVETHTAAGDQASAEESIRQFLEQKLFSYFEHLPYHISLRGLLKPDYEGDIYHLPRLSQTLLSRLTQTPSRLFEIRDLLSQAVPKFASPLYIGSSKSVGARIHKHQNLIERYRQTRPNTASKPAQAAAETQPDHSFAKEVARREMPPSWLSVVVMFSSHEEYLDAENILNRISFPLLGGN